MRRTRVYLTVDVECAEERIVRRRLQPPLDWDLRVWGRLANQREELGIGLLCRELEACSLRGTFFVEALGAAYFGDAGLREVCQALVGRGHDVQLHTHPVQRRADFRSRGLAPDPDDVAAYDLEGQRTILRSGLESLVRAGVSAAGLRAYRAGNFGASNETWRAMAQVGLLLSSNFNPCYRGRSCRIEWPRAESTLFDTGAGVWELPISSFRDAGGWKHLQIMAVSFPELRDYLLAAARQGLGQVTIVTHSFEYFYVDSIAQKRGRPNAINRARLRALCGFLRDRSDLFEVETVGALAARLPAPSSAAAAGGQVPLVRVPRRHRLRRLFEQAWKRWEARRAVPIG